MMSNLKLVTNSQPFPQSTSITLSQGSKQTVQNLVVKDLVPIRHQGSAKTAKQRPSYWMLNIVLLAHIAGLAWLMSTKATLPVIRGSLTPITVSLVNSPTPEPVVVPLLPSPQIQPVIKKTKSIVKQILPTLETVVEQPIIAQSMVTSETPPSPTTPVIAARAQEAVDAPRPKVEHEPIIEPPRFGAAYLHNPAPDYPPLARRFGEQGRVLLRVLVSVSGDVDHVQIETSSGSNKLDQAAIQAVKKWNFIPAKRSNQPISAYVLVPVQFSLEG